MPRNRPTPDHQPPRRPHPARQPRRAPPRLCWSCPPAAAGKDGLLGRPRTAPVPVVTGSGWP